MSDNMTSTERIRKYIQDNHLQKKSIAEAIGVANTTFHTWLARGSDEFPVRYLLPIAAALRVHPMWILTGSEDLPPVLPVNCTELTSDEKYLLDTFRTLDMEGKVVVCNKAVEELRRVRANQGSEASSL